MTLDDPNGPIFVLFYSQRTQDGPSRFLRNFSSPLFNCSSISVWKLFQFDSRRAIIRNSIFSTFCQFWCIQKCGREVHDYTIWREQLFHSFVGSWISPWQHHPSWKMNCKEVVQILRSTFLNLNRRQLKILSIQNWRIVISNWNISSQMFVVVTWGQTVPIWKYVDLAGGSQM